MNKLMSVVLTGDATSLSGTLKRSAAEVNAFEKQVEGSNRKVLGSSRLMAAGVAAAGVTIAAGLAFAVVKAAEFETQMRNVNSISKLSEDALSALGDEVISLSTRLPQSAAELAAGLYDVASSGFQGAEGLQVLEASALAASAGMSDTATASRAITAVLNAYGLQAADAADVSDVLFQTVNVGVVSFEELAGTIGDVVGTAAAGTVAIDEVGAAIATMTLSGISASEAGTSLNRLIQSLIDPSDELATALMDVGYASGAQALQVDDLNVVLEKLRVASGGNLETLLKWFPEIRSARGALALMANEGKNMAETFGAITDEEARAGATQAAFNEQMKATSAQLKLLGNQITAVAIQVGTDLLPVIQGLISGLETLGRNSVPLFKSAVQALTPFWDSLVQIGKNLIDILVTAAETLEPVATAMAGIVVGGVIVFLTGVGEAVEATTGFLAEHETIVKAVALAYTSYLVVQGATAAAQWASTVASSIGAVSSALRNHLSNIAEFTAQAGGKFKALGAVLSNPYLLGAAAVFGTLAAVIHTHNRRAAEAKARAEEFTEAIESQTGAIDDNVNALIAQKFADEELITAANDVGLSYETMADAVVNGAENFDKLRDSLNAVVAGNMSAKITADQMADVLERAGLAGTVMGDELMALAGSGEFTGRMLADLSTKITRLNGDYERGAAQAITNADAQEALGVASGDAEEPVDELTIALQEMTAAQKQATEATQGYIDTVKAQFDPLFGMVDAVNGVRDAQLAYSDAVWAVIGAQADLDAAIRDYGPTSDEAIDAQRDLEDATRDVADAQTDAAGAAMDLDIAARELATAVLTGQTSLDQARGSLQRWTESGALTEEQAAGVAAEFERILADADAMHGRNVEMSVTTHYRSDYTDFRPGSGQFIQSRWGNVLSFAGGGFTPAHITSGTKIKYAEPETGGEAYIPRLGDKARGMAILDHAAGWYGARVTPMAAGGIVPWSGGSSSGGGADPELRSAIMALAASMQRQGPTIGKVEVNGTNMSPESAFQYAQSKLGWQLSKVHR